MLMRNKELKECLSCNEMDMIHFNEKLCDDCLKKKREKNKNLLSI